MSTDRHTAKCSDSDPNLDVESYGPGLDSVRAVYRHTGGEQPLTRHRNGSAHFKCADEHICDTDQDASPTNKDASIANFPAYCDANLDDAATSNDCATSTGHPDGHTDAAANGHADAIANETTTTTDDEYA